MSLRQLNNYVHTATRLRFLFFVLRERLQGKDKTKVKKEIKSWCCIQNLYDNISSC